MKYLHSIESPADVRNLTLEQLDELAAELRQEIVSVVSRTGGHLASNLGSIELTLALHSVFDFALDKLIWDVSHQSYAHKLITGRREQFHTLRQFGGLAGYAKRDESKFDPFGAAHASTSISVALGFAAARDLANENNKVVAVIGDGAMTGGLAFEGMNNAGSLKKDLLVVLNDNTWSISKNVGAISKYLTSILADEKFNKLRDEVWELTGRFKRRDKIREGISRIEHSIKGLLVPGMLFQKLGFRYFGPIDGHDLPLMIKTLRHLSSLSGPVMLHIATVKGKGYEPAEGNAFEFHGVGKFDKVTGKADKKSGGRPAYTKLFGKTMIELAEKNDKVVAVTAAMAAGTGLVEFGEKFPDRFYDVGIAEGHAGCFSAALAADGARPYLTVYSTFLQRAYDQIIHDIAIQNLPVMICMDRAGLVGEDGPTHHGTFDLAYLSCIPNVSVASPKDGNELRSMLHHTADHQMDGPWAFRYPRDTVPTDMTDEVQAIEWGKWERLTEPAPATLLAVGTMVTESMHAAELLSEQGIKIAVVNARFVKPFDLQMLAEVMAGSSAIVTVEEGCRRGGFGQAVGEHLLKEGYRGQFETIALDDSFVVHGARRTLLHEVGLDAEGIAGTVKSLLDRSASISNGLFSKLRLRRSGNGRKAHPVERKTLTESK
ncbi:MAG: 1-deoxy-D-xylulose-5-phosphate synthase [Candidatus Zixiibacteriota bacterium]